MAFERPERSGGRRGASARRDEAERGAVALIARLSNPLPALPRTGAQPGGRSRAFGVRTRRLSESQVDELIRLRQAGWVVTDLASQFGIHRDTVYRHLKRHGLATATGPVIVGAGLDRVASRYGDGESCASIAADLDVDPSTIANALRRAGVSLRPRNGDI